MSPLARPPLWRLLGLAALSGCSTPVPCTLSADCPASEVCVNNQCQAFARADAGPRFDAAPGQDAGPVLDAEVERDADQCPLCGDGDLDRDGDTDADDLALAARYATTDPCGLARLDVDRDGDFDEVDEYLLLALANLPLASRCVGTPCAGACADRNGDGPDDADVEAAHEAQRAAPTACALLSLDVNRDAVIDDRDVALVSEIVAGRVTAECGACEQALECGDVNGDGDINLFDFFTVLDFTTGDRSITPCEYAAADPIGDGSVDRRDAFAIRDLSIDLSAEGVCEPCSAICGDADRSGVVDAADVDFATLVGRGELPPEVPDVICARAISDLNADGFVDARDEAMIGRVVDAPSPPTEPCPVCAIDCGDVDQDGALTAADAALLDTIATSRMGALCERDAADIDGNTTVDGRDARLLEHLLAGRVMVSGPCGVCAALCGDVDGNGAVSAADRAAITAIEGRTPSLCEMANGDIDDDGDVDDVDRELISQIIAGTPPAMPCGR